MTVQEQRLQKEKVRVFELARELDLESKDLMVLCRQNGIELKNQLSTVGPELRDQIVELVKRGPGTAGAQATRAPVSPVLPTVINRKVQTLETRRPPARPAAARCGIWAARAPAAAIPAAPRARSAPAATAPASAPAWRPARSSPCPRPAPSSRRSRPRRPPSRWSPSPGNSSTRSANSRC